MKDKLIKNLDKLFLVILSFTPIVWFFRRGYVVIDGLDTNFPLDPTIWLGRRFFVWDSILNSGHDFNSTVAGIFFHTIQTLPYLLGLDIRSVQVISLIFWFSLVVFSGYFFAKQISRSKLSVVIFSVLYSFNIYLYNTWENIKVANLAVFSGAPILLALFVKFEKGEITKKRLFLYVALIGIVVAGSGINPAYFITILIILGIYCFIKLLTIEKLRAKFEFLKTWLISTSLLIAVNLFWIIPLTYFVFFSKRPSNLEDLGFTNWLSSLSENTSLANIIRLQGAWDWYAKDSGGYPIYIPYALNYFYNPIFILFSFVTPIFSLLSLIFRTKGKGFYYLFFSTLLLLGLFLSAGTHPPTGFIFSFLVERIPFFNFFRSPWYIFSPLVILAYAGLTALLYEYFQDRIRKAYRSVLVGCALLFLLGNLIYSYPLWTGKIFRPGRYDSFFVSFPDYIQSTKKWLENRKYSRIITYPDEQLESFSWGYRGTDSILGLFSNAEFISPTFNSPSKSVDSILEKFYTFIKRSEYQSAISIMKVFAADTLFVKRDVATTAPSITDNIKNFAEKTTFGSWDFYKIPETKSAQKIFSPEFVYLNSGSIDGVAVAANLSGLNFSVLADKDLEVEKFLNKDRVSTLISFNKVGETPEAYTQSLRQYPLVINKDGSYRLVLEKYGINPEALKISIDGTDLSSPSVTESYFVWDVNLLKGDHQIILTLPDGSEHLDPNVDFSKFSSASGLRQDSLPLDIKKTLLIYGSGKDDIDITIPVLNFDPFSKYVISADYKHFYGPIPHIDIIQSSSDSLLKINGLFHYFGFDWEHYSYLFKPVPIPKSSLKLAVRLAKNKQQEVEKSFYENISVKRVYDNQLFLIGKETKFSESTPTVSFKKISPVKYEVEIGEAKNDFILAFLENYNKDWELKSNIFIGTPPHFTVDGYANGWYLPANPRGYKITIYYKPQLYFYLGATLSMIALLAVGLVFLKKNRLGDK